MDLVCLTHVISARKRSLGQGNNVRNICHSVGGGLYDVTSCLDAWSRVPSGGGSLSRGISVQGVSVSTGVSVLGGGGSLSRGSLSGGLRNQKSGRHASYGNAFLLLASLRKLVQ